MNRTRRHVVLVTTISMVVSVLSLASGQLVQAAASQDTHVFQAGNIISDGVFYNSSAMTDSQIQTFLESKEKSCTSTASVDSASCLKSYRATTVTKTAESGLCSGYTGGLVQTAAQIIGGVARSCGINPEVLLVLLEKEQGLVTSVAPAQWRFDSATGLGCPDTAACSSQYKGFFNQVYGAARQFMLYEIASGQVCLPSGLSELDCLLSIRLVWTQGRLHRESSNCRPLQLHSLRPQCRVARSRLRCCERQMCILREQELCVSHAGLVRFVSRRIHRGDDGDHGKVEVTRRGLRISRQ